MGRRFHEISWKWVSTPAPHLSRARFLNPCIKLALSHTHHKRKHTYTHTNQPSHTRTHTHTHTRTHTSTNTCLHAHTHICTHTRTQTHTHTLVPYDISSIDYTQTHTHTLVPYTQTPTHTLVPYDIPSMDYTPTHTRTPTHSLHAVFDTSHVIQRVICYTKRPHVLSHEPGAFIEYSSTRALWRALCCITGLILQMIP